MNIYGYIFKEFIVIYSVILSFSWYIEAQELWCDLKSKPVPDAVFPSFSSSFSTYIEVNVISHGFTSEIIRKVDRIKKRGYMDVRSGTRHVLYLSSDEDDTFLMIKYQLTGTTCKTFQLSQTNKSAVFDEKDAGPRGILQILEEEIFPKTDKFQALQGKFQVRGVTVQCWQTCQYLKQLGAAVKVTAYFSSGLRPDSDTESENDLLRLEIEAKNVPGEEKGILIFADFFDNSHSLLQDKDFQIPELVYCSDYRTGKKEIPFLPNYFTYESEITSFASSSGFDAVVNHRAVHYDYKGGMARVEYQGSGQVADVLNPIDTKIHSFIFDFNSGLQYAFDPIFDTCSIAVLDSSLDVIDKFDSTTIAMLDPKEFFHLNESEDSPISYNGIYETRGFQTDVYSRRDWVNNRILFWYFTSDRTKLVQEVSVEKNILVKIISLPETDSVGTEGRIDINIYNFIQQESRPFTFDITSCYNESFAKEYILTFDGSEDRYPDEVIYLFKMRLQQTIREITGISSRRIIIQQIEFQDSYILTQFKILDLSPVQGAKPITNQNDLETAVELLKKSVDSEKFQVELSISKDHVKMFYPVSDGLKEFKPDRPVYEGEIFHESSFAGMSIGMAVLGFLLGGIVVNLIVTKKYGVSLLQSNQPPALPTSFSNPLDESSI